jgi:5-methylcytosine-specific restriction endonuclease McrA
MAVENCSTKECTKCGEVKPASRFYKCAQQSSGLRPDCKDCSNSSSASARNKRADYYRSKKSDWLQKNKHLRSATTKKYYKNNKEKISQYHRVRYENNRESILARCREWAANNVEKRKAIGQNRRARVLAAEGSFTGDDIARLYQLQRGKCVVCYSKLDKSYHIDHIVPIARGGDNYPNNLQLLCPTCNRRKAAKDPVAFMREIGRLL